MACTAVAVTAAVLHTGSWAGRKHMARPGTISMGMRLIRRAGATSVTLERASSRSGRVLEKNFGTYVALVPHAGRVAWTQAERAFVL